MKQEPIYVYVEHNPQPSRYRNLLEAFKNTGHETWNTWYLFAFRPEMTQHLASNPEASSWKEEEEEEEAEEEEKMLLRMVDMVTSDLPSTTQADVAGPTGSRWNGLFITQSVFVSCSISIIDG